MATSKAHAREVAEYAAEHGDAAAQRFFSLSSVTLERYKRIAHSKGGPAPKPPETTKSDEVRGDARTITTRSPDITNLEQLLVYSKVDRSLWDVDRYVVNSWEVTLGAHAAGGGDPQTFTNYQVKAWLKRKQGESREDILSAFRADAAKHAPRYPAFKRKRPESGNELEISAPDLHLGLLAWGRETRGADYDIRIAEKVFLDAILTLAHSAQPYGFGRIILPIGNDFFHVDNAAGATAAGTKQDIDSRWQKSFTEGRRIVVAAVDQLRALAPVKVVIVPGNHDAERVFYLGDSLVCWYRRCADVQVDNEPQTRKYHQHGRCLIGWTHGCRMKVEALPLLMAQEVPDLWAATEYREIHTGHLHHSDAKSYQQDTEHVGVRVRMIPSLAAPSAWTASTGYRAIREAIGFVWNDRRGPIATMNYHPEGSEKDFSRGVLTHESTRVD